MKSQSPPTPPQDSHSRTPETLTRLTVFKTAAFDHSATSPAGTYEIMFPTAARLLAELGVISKTKVKTVKRHGKRAYKVEPIAPDGSHRQRFFQD